MNKKLLAFLLGGVMSLPVGAADIFYYSPADGGGGLRIAVRQSDGVWKPIGENFDLVKSDFGPWGSHKKMWTPQLFQTPSGWNLLFRATSEGDVIGLAESQDLITWRPQKYMAPADTAALSFRRDVRSKAAIEEVSGKQQTGYVMKVDDSMIPMLEAHVAERNRLSALYSERCADDSARFAGLQTVAAKLKGTGESKEISPLLMGIFFEDINYAADGGLYAELIQNRDFEYTPKEGREKGWDHDFAWSVTGDKINFTIATDNPIHPNNPHFARLEVKGGISSLLNGGGNAFVNSGFDGIAVKKGEPYRLRFKARADKNIPVDACLVNGATGKRLVTGKLKIKKSRDWTDYDVLLTPDEHCPDATLQLVPKFNGTLDLDMVSLFPVNTFNGRDNGLRADLAKTLAALKPRFVRFPGGCVAHGNGLDNVYDWKGSIGKLEERKPLRNLWGYHQTRGLGYHEYFQFCEDIGAEPLPVVAAGVPCQNSGIASRFTHDALTRYGQQCGLPMDSLDSYIQDILDLIEYANGPATSVWGRKRAEAGHPEPFNLKYIGIGNEDMITEVFEERFRKINAAVKKAHPEIMVVGTVGPFYEGPDYEAGWRLAREENVDLVDEHYYVDPAWLIYNQDFYDKYDRNGTKVYLGEWASHLPGRPSNMETALSEALYLTAVERNGDVVSMSSYAPLLAKEKHTQWRPDLIYFNNTEVKPTTDYETMRLYGENGGTTYLATNLEVDSENEKVRARIGASVVKDAESGDIIVKLVNMLPVEADIEADLTSYFPEGQGEVKSVRTVMSGKPADTKASLKTDRVTLESPFFKLPLAPYSFTILRLGK